MFPLEVHIAVHTRLTRRFSTNQKPRVSLLSARTVINGLSPTELSFGYN